MKQENKTNIYSFKHVVNQTKQEFKKGNIGSVLYRYFLIVLGSAILAIASAFFLVPGNIVSGGVSGIGIVISTLFNLNATNVITILQVIFFILGYLLLGADFTFKTLLSTVLYPCFLYLFTFVHNSIPLFQLEFVDANGVSNITNMLIGGLAGGGLVGIAVGLTFSGGGSTGGIDCLPLFCAKLLKIKPSIMTFTFDCLVIFSGLFIHGMTELLIDIFSAFIAALAVDKTYISSSKTYMANIISSKWELINKAINEELLRGTTLFDCEGGYTHIQRKMIQVAFSYDEYLDLQKIIYNIDKDAFLTVTNASSITGMGFNKIPKKLTRQINKNNKDNKKGE